MWCVLELLTRHSQEAQPEAGRKDRPEGNPVEHRDRLEGSSGSPAGHMDPGQDSFAEAGRTAHMGLRLGQAQLQVLRQQLGQQLCARHQSRLQSVVSIQKR